MAMRRSRCREEEPTRYYIKLVLGPQMGQGIMPNTVRESQVISFNKSEFEHSMSVLHELLIDIV